MSLNKMPAAPQARRWTALVVAMATALTAGGIALAQGGGSEGGDSGGSTEDGSVSTRRRSDLTGPEQLAEAERVSTTSEALSRRVQAMLDDARRDGDVLRVTCLDDKLTQINAHRRTLASRVESLQGAVQSSETDLANHEFTVITVLSQNFSHLDRAANECIGQDMYETGTTRVTTTIDPGTPQEDPSLIPVVPPGVQVPFIPPPESDE